LLLNKQTNKREKNKHTNQRHASMYVQLIDDIINSLGPLNLKHPI